MLCTTTIYFAVVHGPLGVTIMSTFEAFLYQRPLIVIQDCLDNVHACNSRRPMRCFLNSPMFTMHFIVMKIKF